jgi:drug/metabolite transporter (DMT)-like permease
VQYQPHRGIQSNRISWMIRVILSILSFGSVGVLLKLSTTYAISFIDILVSMYAGGLLYLGCFLKPRTIQKLEFGTAGIVAILSVIGFSLYIFALKSGPASIIYPIVSLNCMVVILASLIIFKERLRAYQIVGMIFAIFGLVLVKI